MKNTIIKNMVMGTIHFMFGFLLLYLIASFVVWGFIPVTNTMIRIYIASSIIFSIYGAFVDYNKEDNPRE